jgi:ABC-2 type transport system ATP-binding protein
MGLIWNRIPIKPGSIWAIYLRAFHSTKTSQSWKTFVFLQKFVVSLQIAGVRERALEILEFVGLVDFTDRLAGNLSGGMKQKLGLASALVHQPRLLLLDEPTGGVDPVTRQDFWQLILRIVAEEGVGVIVSTPHMDEVARCHQVAMMKDGRIVLKGSARELREPLSDRIIEIHGAGRSADRNKLTALPEVEDVQSFGDSLHVRVLEFSPGFIKKTQKLYPACQVRRISSTLEDVFIAYMEKKGGKP